MNIKQSFTTPAEHTKGTNTCRFVILHHTGTKENTIKGVLDGLNKRADYASCHYCVDTNGDLYKIGNDTDILRHAGASQRKTTVGLNNHSIGIEIIGPLSNGGFTDEQRATVASLVIELCGKYGIPKENVLRHADLTNAGSPKGILWDGVSASRKVDVATTFWSNKFRSFESYRDSLFYKKPTMAKSKYTDIMLDTLKDTGFDPIFTAHDGSGTLTEQETKELIEIAFARFADRSKTK